MRKILYYHIYIRWEVDSWLDMFLEQMKCMEDAGLLKEFDKLHFIAINRANNPLGRKYLTNAVYSYISSDKCIIEFVDNPFPTDEEMMKNIDNSSLVSENYTYRKLYNYTSKTLDNELICYIHTKGITRSVNYSYLDINSLKRYYYWRQYLNWGVLTNWKTCVNKIENEDYDVAGINYYDEPSSHFSGNFWWTKSSHIRTLPNPDSLDWWYDLKINSTDPWLKNVATERYRDEQWLCSRKETKVYNVANLEHSRNPAFRLLTKSEYGDIN